MDQIPENVLKDAADMLVYPWVNHKSVGQLSFQ